MEEPITKLISEITEGKKSGLFFAITQDKTLTEGSVIYEFNFRFGKDVYEHDVYRICNVVTNELLKAFKENAKK